MDRGFVEDWRRRSKASPYNTNKDKEDLFLLYCDKVENGEIDPEYTDSYVVVDNFYVNGNFIYHNDTPYWNKVCETAIVCNDKIAIDRFI